VVKRANEIKALIEFFRIEKIRVKGVGARPIEMIIQLAPTFKPPLVYSDKK
jgi:hypothetical protein